MSSKAKKRSKSLAGLTDSQILKLRFCDLPSQTSRGPIKRLVNKLYAELTAKKINLKPHIWISTEWFSPDNIPGIAIPFYMTHPKLKELEKSMMYEVEGGNTKDAMKILRHESGHAFCTAFRLHYRAKWRKIFGSPSKPYPEAYRPQPLSKNYVLHLAWWYGQAHPDEDFAETFAVWLSTPKSVWLKQYKTWPALKKLKYIDELMVELANQKPLVTSQKKVEPLSKIKQTLFEHYKERHSKYSHALPDLYDNDLLRLFSKDPKFKNNKKASQFLRARRKQIRHTLSLWTHEHEYMIDQVIHSIIERCSDLNLRLMTSEKKTESDALVLMTVQIMNMLYRSREWIAL